MDKEFLGTERFAIQCRLGEGGMGVVYQAYDQERHQAVALKILNRVDATGIYRLKQEFRSLADVSHPNLVTLYDLISTGQDWFFTMELVEGVSLTDWVQGERPEKNRLANISRAKTDVGREARREHRESTGYRTLRSEEEAETSSPATDPTVVADALLEAKVEPPRNPNSKAQVLVDSERLRTAFGQLAEAVNALHRAGKLHRDLKPNNVLVNRNGQVKVLDFGLVQDNLGLDTEHTLEENLIIGTPAFMAPEQAAGKQAGAPCDWYAFGVILYLALTGRLPFEGTVRQVLLAKQVEAPPSPKHWAPDTPEDLSNLCQELLGMAPETRPEYDDIIVRLAPSAVHVVATTRTTSLTPPRSAPGASFFGRSRELRVLLDTVLDSRRGRPILGLIKAPPGMGKTALLDRFAEHLTKTTNTLVLSGRCYPQESVPYKAFDAIIDALSRHLRKLGPQGTEALLPRNVAALCRLFPVLERVEGLFRAPRCGQFEGGEEDQRPRAFAALKELISRIADRQPLVLRVDDLQWGDLDSADLLLTLLSPPDPPAIFFIGAYRSSPSELGPMLKRLLGSTESSEGNADQCSTIRRDFDLQPLDPESGLCLALDVMEAYDDASWGAAKTIVRESGGNPLLIQELGRHFAEADEEWQDIQNTARSSLDQLAMTRLARLDTPQRDLLVALAVIGSPIETPTLGRITGLEAQIHPTLEQLTRERLVRSTRRHGAHAVELVHEGLQRILLSSVSAAQIRRTHRKLATELSLSGRAAPEAMALHLRAAGELRLAAEQAILAAERATRSLAFDRAASFLELALKLGPGDRVEPWELRARLGDVLAQSGKTVEAIEALLGGAREAPLLEAVRLTKRAAELRLQNSRVDALFAPGEDGGSLLFEGISREEVQELLGRSAILTAPRGERLIAKDASTRCFYVVIAGAVELKKSDGTLAGHLGEGAILGEVAFLMRSPLVAEIFSASDDVRLLALSQDSLDELATSKPTLALRLVLNLSRVICDKVSGVRARALRSTGLG